MIRTKTCLFDPTIYERFDVIEEPKEDDKSFSIVGVKRETINVMSECGSHLQSIHPQLAIAVNLTEKEAKEIMDDIQNSC